ncbi:MAG: peptidyl-prolyl cis-trans isomerase [Candidatus Rokubacteria bacterium]|nr:peptidyl-prolyl cis-trans isomerase [Candidatus Rokubacteria bacterium]
MMTWMRRVAPYLLAAVLIAFLVSLAYFGSSGTSGGGGGAQAAVVTVDGDVVSAVAFDRAYRAAVEQTRQLAGDRWTEDLPRVLRLRDQVIERLVDERLVARGAAREGIVVSDAELAEQIMRIGAFQEGGRFSRERYVRLLAMAQAPMAPSDFEADFRTELVRQRLQALIADGAKVSEGEVRQAWEVDRSRVRAGYLLVPAGSGEALQAPDAELDAYYKAHPAEFTKPEGRRVLAAILPAASVPPPGVTDADVEAAYKVRRAQFEQPTRAKVSHLLIKVPAVGGSAAEDQAKARAESALGRIRGGADFAQVAKEMSEDPSTASRGGDLGLIAAGELVPEVDKLIQSLKPGELGGPIRSPFGYHVVKVFEVVPGLRKELKEVAPTLRATLAAEGQLKAHRDRAQDAQRALLVAADFAVEARRLGFTVREAGPLRRGDPVEGIGRVTEASDAIFALPPDGVSSPVRVPEGLVIFRLVSIEPARLLPLEEARPDVLRAVRRQKALDAAKGRAEKLLEAVRRGEDPRALTRQGGATYGEIGPFSPAEPLGDRALGQVLAPVALTLAEGGVGGPVEGPGGFYVVKLLGRDRPDPAAFEPARAALEARLLREKRARLWQAWLSAARAGAKIEINRQLLSDSQG